MIDTKQKILDTAERLFGENGYGATSLRQIIAEAGVNLAAIHYHFGSKEELLDHVVVRKAGPVNEERLAILDRLEAAAADKPVAIEPVLRAFLLPAMRKAGANPEFARLMGRLYGEGMMMTIVRRHFGAVASRFFPALRKAVPGLTDEEFRWRVHFLTGAMAHTLCMPPEGLTGSDVEVVMERLVAFMSGGLRAPAAEKLEIEEK